MKPSPVMALAALVLAAAGALHAQQTAQIMLPVSDAQGTPLATLNPTDLEIFENGQPLKIVKIEPQDSQMTVTLALDNGRQMGDIIVHLRSAAREFFTALPPSVEVALMTTAPQPRYVVRATRDREAVLRAIDTIAPELGPGRTIEAIQDVASTWKKIKPEVWPALVVLGSTFSPELVKKNHAEEALAVVKGSRATVHVVMYKPAGANDGDAQLELSELFAQTTRGRYEIIGSYLQLGVLTEIAKDIAKNVNRQFLLTLERPAGATGRLGPLSISPADGIVPGRITRVP